jgi:hypothetical protein
LSDSLVAPYGQIVFVWLQTFIMGRTPMPHAQPPFLKGTFFWDQLGYSYLASPPLNLLATEALDSENVWISLAGILEHAKAGNHAPLQRLQEWMRADIGHLLLCVCAELLGDAATTQDLRALENMLLEGPDHLRVAACRAAYWSGELWLVPLMIDSWNRVEWRDDRDTIAFMLSDLLEETAGPIVANEAYSASQYNELVRRRVEELHSEIGTDRVSVWEGKVFGVTQIARRMYELLLSEGESVGDLDDSFIDYRHKFEASTGINCSSFFRNEEFQPLAATAILEEFLESGQGERYEDGVRYFFGHRIPD